MIYTIGFTRTTAEHFFQRLRDAGVGLLLDIRLNNRSQLAGFAKYPDIQWFVKELCGAEYIHDDFFAPTEEILKAYQRHNIDWAQYEIRFDNLMAQHPGLHSKALRAIHGPAAVPALQRADPGAVPSASGCGAVSPGLRR